MHPYLQTTLGPSAALEPEIQTWLARVRSAGGVVNGRSRDAANLFVKQCKSADIWTSIRRVNLCIGDFLASFVPLVNTSGGAADTNNAILLADYNESLGWRGNGTTKWIDTGYTPSEATGGLAAYLRTDITTTSTILIGCRNSANNNQYRILFTTTVGGSFSWSGSGVAAEDGVTAALSRGFIHSARRAATDLSGYRNGASVASQAASVTPSSPSASIGVMCQNIEGGTQNGFCQDGTFVAGYSIDTGLTAVKLQQYYQIMQRFQSTMGRAV